MSADNAEQLVLQTLLDHYQNKQPGLITTIQQGLAAGLRPARIEAAVARHCPAGSGVPLHVRLLADHFGQQRRGAIRHYADRFSN